MFLLLYLFVFIKEVSGQAGQNIYDVTCYFESNKGETYNGTVNTANGTPCKNWKTYNSTFVPYYPDHNYCRNPRTDALLQPWCYIADEYVFAICNIDVCVCKPGRFGNTCEQTCHCKEPDCNDITGHCSGAGCEEKWTGDSCNECSSQWFGQNCERFCHCLNGECDNITGVCYKPGCMKGWTGDSCNYTTDCVLKIKDTTYNGTVNTTRSNLPCKRWYETAKSPHYRALEENFCRNPSFDFLDYPWCFTETGHPRFEMCAIPLCACQPGFYGENCQSECHCAVDGCNTISGECNNPTAGCKVPWTGRNCSIRFSCPDLQTKSTSNLLTSPTLTGNHINDTVKFGCDKGFALLGPDTLLCIINDSHTGGKWSNNIPICQSIVCSKRSLHLTSSEVMHAKTEMFIFEEVVNISCKQGYIGEVKQSKCVNLNKWNGNRPVCRESHTILEEKGGIYMTYGVFGGILVTIVIISAGVYIGGCFYHRRRVRKHITIYEALQFKSVQRQTVNLDDTYVELQ